MSVCTTLMLLMVRKARSRNKVKPGPSLLFRIKARGQSQSSVAEESKLI